MRNRTRLLNPVQPSAGPLVRSSDSWAAHLELPLAEHWVRGLVTRRPSGLHPALNPRPTAVGLGVASVAVESGPG